jgi:serine/threonine protein kinase
MSDQPVVVRLTRDWQLGQRIGGGGFGEVFEATAGTEQAAVKLVPKAPGADRELLFVDLPAAVNVVPILDSGEHADSWAIVMPLATRSLRQELDQVGALAVGTAVRVLTDIVAGLASLDGSVVHRDLKPENILLLGDSWCLADFGISRYAEATTAPDTHKFSMSPPYAAPERWRSERATAATDIYSVGIMAHELLAGSRPFDGSIDELREKHLHAEPPVLEGVPSPLGALIDEMLYKAPGARPPASNALARLARAASASTPGLAGLQQANQEEARRTAERNRQESQARTEAETRNDLLEAAKRSFDRISQELQTAIVEAAPSAKLSATGGGWSIRLGPAELRLGPVRPHASADWGGWQAPAFDVVATSSLSLTIPADRYEYEGRSHSLWFGDVQRESEFRWFETSFMVSPPMAQRGRQDPFALEPGEESAKAVWNGMAEFQLAWPFSSLVPGELEDFIDRWAGWLAAASAGRLTHPSSMPERAASGSWRTK